MDIDEIIVGTNSSNWASLVQNLETKFKKSTAFCFEMLLFVDKITKGADVLATAPNLGEQNPSFPYMMNKLNYELKTICNPSGTNGKGLRGRKCLHSTKNVFLVHNHFPRSCMIQKEWCWEWVNNTVAYVHHHKDSCEKQREKEELLKSPFGYDPTIRRHNDELMARSRIVLDACGL